jgi:2-polyprenyl-3-methyl-5-hydroxy-6-metoxy-1,4-benzoquinol methylase
MNDKPISFTDPVGSHTLQVIEKANRFNLWMYLEFRSFLKGEILEIGSGIGNVSQLVINDGLSITLTDYNAEYCLWLKKKFSASANVKAVIEIDLLHSDFKTYYAGLQERFDTIFLLNVIEHLADDVKAIANCRFLLKQGGHLIVLAPAYQNLYCRLDKELGHYRRYTIKNLKAILEKENFDIMKMKYFNFLGIWGWLFTGKILRRKKLGKNEVAAFNNLVPLAKILDNIVLKKIGLSVIVTGIKRND